MTATDLGSPAFPLHPLHGPHQPTTHTPPRRPHSVRRTTSIDMTREENSLDPVYLNGAGRDLFTAGDGSARELGRAAVTATIDLVPRVVQHIDTTPAIEGLSRLAGAPAMSGFRAAVDGVAPQLRKRRELLYALLDDVPVATLISGHALSASGVLGAGVKSGYLPVADQCAGFVTGGLLMSSFEAGDPAIVTGPVAPQLDDPTDPAGWHDMAPLPLHGMRRRRRLDVAENDDAATVSIDAMFRDTYVRADGLETIIHEYTLAAAVDPTSGLILRSEAVPRVLPWRECPGAVASAQRITGMTLTDLHFRVRHELTGTSTCTHLNDLLRFVADARALIEHL
ncbi:DUF2889 domain-containing protein [Mycobacterium europaeum]|uniref:DUF2889 domain-containing protein n=1 Tax=Mycobacterium europaeum TaxID=761804 RepID=UPI001B80058C|nr:DUF2889 domain-containing protein [Mycobacterium europaeum]